MRSERPEQDRQSKDEIIERRSGVRCCSLREVFEIVMTHDQSRTLRAHPDARHPRVTIRVCEINIPRDKNVRVIGAPRRENQRAQDRNFNCESTEVRRASKRDVQSDFYPLSSENGPARIRTWDQGIMSPLLYR